MNPIAVAALGLILVLFFLKLRLPVREKSVRGGYSKLSAAPVKSDLRFSDVAANAEALKSLEMLVDYLRNPVKYAQLGAKMPRGVLLWGPPGTGKTLLARALAGEADVAFYALSGSDFVQMYAGVGAGRVRDLFAKARAAGKCVIFIDEIDALGRKRGTENASDERDQTLNALLSEMSGFKGDEGIVVLAATNRPETLDPALTRPGRFDRTIEVGLPGKAERLDILKLHSRSRPIDRAVDLNQLAVDTVRFSGASLENLLNEAAILAVQRGLASIGQAEISDAYIRTVAGAGKPSTASAGENVLIALHESGHALASVLLQKDAHLNRVTILPAGGGAAGYSLTIPPERTLTDRKALLAQIDVLLAGRAAEWIAGGEEELTAGAANDLARAAELAAAMVCELGLMGEPAVSLRAVGDACKAGMPDAPALCRRLLGERFESVSKLLAEKSDLLYRLTEALVEQETLTGDQVRAICSSGQ